MCFYRHCCPWGQNRVTEHFPVLVFSLEQQKRMQKQEWKINLSVQNPLKILLVEGLRKTYHPQPTDSKCLLKMRPPATMEWSLACTDATPAVDPIELYFKFCFIKIIWDFKTGKNSFSYCNLPVMYGSPSSLSLRVYTHVFSNIRMFSILEPLCNK